MKLQKEREERRIKEEEEAKREKERLEDEERKLKEKKEEEKHYKDCDQKGNEEPVEEMVHQDAADMVTGDPDNIAELTVVSSASNIRNNSVPHITVSKVI